MALAIAAKADAGMARGLAQYQHLPTARSADFYGDGFLAKLADWASSLKGKETPVCVYCSDAGCPTSGTAANALAEAGWTNVAKFKGGLAEWDSADLDFEGDIEDE